MKTYFEKKLKDLGFSYQCNTNGLYILSLNNNTNSIINTQLICSEPVDESKVGSRNGNVIQSVGHFKFKLPDEGKDPDFFILAIPNTNNPTIEFIIIPPKELKGRLHEQNRTSTDNQEIEIVFWLMVDNCLYNCTNIGAQGEWFYMSKGLNGRLADETDWCYTKFLNGWDGLKMV